MYETRWWILAIDNFTKIRQVGSLPGELPTIKCVNDLICVASSNKAKHGLELCRSKTDQLHPVSDILPGAEVVV